MLFILTILMNKDSTYTDSVKVEELGTDTIAVESLKVYPIPEIINGHTQSELDRNIYIAEEITPEIYDFYLSDAFFRTPFTFNKNGNSISISQRAMAPNYTTIFLNDHPIYEPILGYFDVNRLPTQFFERVEITRDAGHNFEGINLLSKVNRYDKPYSYLSFTTIGFNTIYNIDFTRALTKDLGFYLGGLYSNSWVLQDSLYFKLNSFYTNLYYNQFLPIRFDLVYSSNNYGAQENGNFIDVSFISGNKQHKMAIYYNSNTTTYFDTVNISSINKIKNYGFDTEIYYNPKFFEIFLNLTGLISDIATQNFGDYTRNSLSGESKLNKSYKNLTLSIANQTTLLNTKDFFNRPQFTVGYNVFDSISLRLGLGHSFREPTIFEMYAPEDTSNPDYWTRGNPDLRPEYYWTKELGIKRKKLFFNIYKADFDDFIINEQDTEGYYIPINIGSRSFVGIENYLELTLGRAISLGCSGNYLIKGDTLSRVPRNNFNLFISLKKETPRADFGLLLKGQYVAKRFDILGHELAGFSAFSLVGTIKFITLGCVLRIDNILDEGILEYPIPARNFNLSVKWEFWD